MTRRGHAYSPSGPMTRASTCWLPLRGGYVVGAENLCHQAIFMNHASGAVTPLNPEVVQVGDAVGQRAQWRGLLEGAVRPVGIVKVLVVPQHHHQVPLVPDQGSVQQLTSAAADPPFHDRIHSRRLNG